ncbi:replication factor C subunit 1 isoform X2 [Diorhabda sublineata]|uniref:replication factor C subunit 1 isoform X2 n=1 Tax=Diorhabda sublineata TaxID=1163346 RepID=UPI0024E0E6EC|nr:replication factor C subunit 1 isoform X2 [Diorhabda sublineata]
MPQDIRRFFSVISNKNTTSKTPETKKKVKRLVDSDDDDDIIVSTPEQSKKKIEKSKRKSEKAIVIVSDSDDEPDKKEIKLKPVDINDVFSDKPIKQNIGTLPRGDAVKVESKLLNKPNKKKKVKTEVGVHNDEAFEKTLLELDDGLLSDNLELLEQSLNDALEENTKTKKRKSPNEKTKTKRPETDGKDEEIKSKQKKLETDLHPDEAFKKTLKNLDEESYENKKTKVSPKATDSGSKQSSSNEDTPNKPKDNKKNKRQRTPSEGSTPKKPKLDESNSEIDPDQERFEKKRYSAMLYQKYLNRSGPKMHGQKEIPKGKSDCLAGLTFLRTGVLDSLEGEEFLNLAKEHGGRVVHAVSKKVNYVVVGEDPGPAKLEKARGYKIPEINEDEFFDLILVKSGLKPKYSKKSQDSYDSGVYSFEGDDKQDKKKQKDCDEVSEKKKKKHKIEEQDKKFDEFKKVAKTTSVANEKEDQSHNKTESKRDKTNKGNSKTSSFWTNSSKPSKSTKSKSPSKASVNSSESTENRKNIDSIQSVNFNSNNREKSVESISVSSEKDEATVSSSLTNSMAWTDKYKPIDTKGIIGQQGDGSNMNKLSTWLSNWYRNQLPAVRKKIPRPSPWAKNDNGAYYKAALLSGPPGVGKTTTATLVSKAVGFDVVEFNASDTRSKKLLQEEVAQLLSTTTIAGYAAGKARTDRKRVLLMDEVDGMAGNEDRGGIQELINLIKTTSVPIICMCNDRNHQKMRSLVNYCFDLRFAKPRLEQIRGAMMSICFKEGLKISPNVLSEIIAGTGCDIRQSLNHLTMWAAQNKNMSLEEVQSKAKEAKKDTVLGPWEVVRMVFTESEQKNMTLSDKIRLFYYDYSMGPLFVQENYLGITPKCPKSEVMKRVALAADSISKGDLVDAKIRSSNNWSLLESQAMYSSVLPGYYMSGHVSSRINFPGWLGKNSSANKRKRMLNELHVHTRMSTSGNVVAMKLDYLVPLRNAIITPLLKYGVDGIQQSIAVMDAYTLLREDLTNILELCHWKDDKNPFNDIDSKVKSAFTRAYNKIGHKLPFAPGAGFSKKKSRDDNPENEDNILESDEDDEQEDNEDVNVDSLIKIGKTSKKETTKPSTSKTKGKAKKQK